MSFYIHFKIGFGILKIKTDWDKWKRVNCFLMMKNPTERQRAMCTKMNEKFAENGENKGRNA